MNISSDVIKRIAAARRIAVLTGAGISAESGIPTFRGEDGIWKKIRPEELASMDAFLKNPALVWEWYEYRRKIIRDVTPNAAHYTLAEMEKHLPHLSISTQNIDGLHQRAGSARVYELHGNILRNRCNNCGRIDQNLDLGKDKKRPTCECGGLIRPDVVWFGEMLPADILDKSFEEAQNADVYFSIGTSAVVYPAAQLPVEALHNGAYVIEINLEPTPLTSRVHAHYHGKAGDILPELWQAVKNEIGRLDP